MEMVSQGDSKDQMPNIDVITRFLPDIDLFFLLQPDSAQSLRFWDARTIVSNGNKLFKRLVIIQRLSKV
jgi:hypothetical protein